MACGKILVSVLLFVTALTSRPAGAEEIDEKIEEKKWEQATQAFERGRFHFERNEYPEAAEAFRMAYTLKPNWKLLYNIGQSDAAAKRYGLALESFEAYLAQGGDEIEAERRDELLKEVENLRKMVAVVDVKAPVGAVITVDGIKRGIAPLSGPVMISAGVDHQFIVANGEEILDRQIIKLSGGMQREIVVEEKTEAAEIDPASEDEYPDPTVYIPESTQKPKSGLKVAGFVLTGVGAAMLVAGAVTGGIALSRDGDLETVCKDGCPPEKSDEAKSVDNLAIATNVLIGIGAASAVAGIIMVVVGNKKEHDTNAVSITPVVLPEFAGAAAAWRF